MYRFRLLAAILFVTTLFTGPMKADTYPRQPGLDAQHYVFRIALNDASDEIDAEATARLRFVSPGVSEFWLDLASVANGKGMVVSDVTSKGLAIPYVHAMDRLTIKLPAPPPSGGIQEFTIRYHGIPAAGLLIGVNKFQERVFFGSNWPDKARQWLPVVDHPSDKATSEFIVTAPSKYQVVANGLLQEVVDRADGTRVTHWKQSVPIASWLNTIGVSRFASKNFGTVHGIPVQTWVFPQETENGAITFEVPTRQAMNFYMDYIGPYPYEKLANVEAAGVSGGMELASSIFYGERAVTNKPAESLVAHEIAHQWFGDSVTEKDWDDVWLSEGFATYFALLTSEHQNGRDAFVAGLKRSREGVFKAQERNPGIAIRHNNLSDMKKVLNQVIYQKGGWTLHMLRAQVGTETFWTGIRDYYRRYRDSNASTDDFRRVMEVVSGQDLSWFFEQWLNRAGTPIVEGKWQYDAAAKQLEIDLAQTQPGDPYRLPLEIGFADKIEKIQMTGKRQTFRIALEKEPQLVALDPGTWTLMTATFSRK
jgi:aminopeptidase N